MSLDTSIPDLTQKQTEAARQIEICNACRYCEGYCSVFPAMFAEREFTNGDITQLANLCHNCRGCYYACQYTEPHEFALNLPAALAEVRSESMELMGWPGPLAGLFHRYGVALVIALVLGIAIMFWGVTRIPSGGDGFYAYLAHGAMVSIFAPAFLLPLIALWVSVRRQWRATGGGAVGLGELRAAFVSAATMRNLAGGQGQGCNFEQEDRFSNARRHAHQSVMWGFFLCFAATASGTILHYLFAIQAPYGLISIPKLFGIPGGILMTIGAAGLAVMKMRADRNLGDRHVWGGEMAFVLLIGWTGLSGLLLFAATGTGAVPSLLALHLGSVLTLFLTTPYSKMAHGAYRFTALVRDAVRQKSD